MKNKKKIIILTFLIVLLIFVNYNFFNKNLENFFLESETGIVERVIDGDTVVLSTEEHVRLLGINSPERGEEFYQEAKEFLESLVLNKTVKIVFGKEKKDKYNRVLAYIFLENINVNLKLVEKGFANYYFPSGKDSYYSSFEESWEECINENNNLCEHSTNYCSECIELKNLDVKNQEIIFQNKCIFNCDLTSWNIKDEGRKNFVFPEFTLQKESEVKIIVEEGSNSKETLFWTGENYVLTDTGDTIFLRDKENKLVLWQSY
tara:strand:+ start:2457 stop:3242 length:786 start_codon:yes stop_codon:yes gene_type:complete